MPADLLEPPVETIEAAIAKVITGTPLADAASTAGVPAETLADAIEIYRQAGRRALHQHTDPGWWHINIQFADWDQAEQAATDHVTPLLLRAEADSLITGWWFIRKHPCWRLRLRPSPTGRTMPADVSTQLDRLTAQGQISAWWPGIYEPETAAFGGSTGIDIAHDLFCDDSRAVAALLRGDPATLGRRELSLLLCGTLMRAANLEWYEQGDVWHRITQERPLPTGIPGDRITTMVDQIKDLLLADTAPDGPLLAADGPLAPIAGWADAFRQTGRALAAATREGTLQRGLREIISYLVIFHWNRLGLHVRTQSILASAACTAILETPLTVEVEPASRLPASQHTTAADVQTRLPIRRG